MEQLFVEENYKMERSVVWFSNKMIQHHQLRTKKERKQSKYLLDKMQSHLNDLIQYKEEYHSQMIYFLWEQFSDVYKKWMNN